MKLQKLKQWLKSGDTPLSKALYRLAMSILHFEMPNIRAFNKLLLTIHKVIANALESFLRVCYWTPMFKAYVENDAKGLYLYGGLPYVGGRLKIRIGERSRVSGATTFTGRSTVSPNLPEPLLDIGSNVDVGWQTTIAVGSLVKFGDNVRIAGKGFFAGYPGHPLDPIARAEGKPELDSQVGDIILEDDVWLATGVSVMAGVTIGKGTVVAAGSVVTKDLPPGVLAGGVPAKVIRKLDEA